jgi:hypothetical protein
MNLAETSITKIVGVTGGKGEMFDLRLNSLANVFPGNLSRTKHVEIIH